MPTGAMTLLEAAKTMPASQATGIVMTYASAYHPMVAMPMITEPQGIHSWNVENELSYTTGGTRLVNGTWTATRSNISAFTETFKIYGGEIQVDRAIAKVNPGKVPQEKESQTKAKARIFTSDFIAGGGGQALRGIDDWLANETLFAGQTSAVGTASAGSVLLTDHLDKLLSLLNVVPGSTYIYCSDNIALRASKLGRGNVSGSDVPYNNQFRPEEWGFWNGMYRGVPIIPLKDGKGSDLISITEGDGSSTTIYGVTYGTEMLTGFQVSAPDVIPLTQADVYNYFDFEHLVGVAPKAIKCIARLTHVTDTV